MTTKYLLILLVFIAFKGTAQQQIMQNFNSSLTITPDGIQSTRPTSGLQSLGIGNNVLRFNTGIANTGVGQSALSNNTTGFQNTAMGYAALMDNQTGYNNTAFGNSALGKNNSGAINTAIGSDALFYNTNGSFNTAIGSRALYFNENGNFNTAVGASSLSDLVHGIGNTAIGMNALYSLDSGSLNLAVGVNALYYYKGDSAVAIGNEALGSLVSGENNVAVGNRTLFYNQSGNGNTVIGDYGFQNNTGSHNTGIGYDVFAYNTTGSGNVGIGYMAGRNETGSSKLYIENSDSDRPLIGGDFNLNRVGINRTMTELASSSKTFQVNGDASKNVAGAWLGHSDRRLKKNISPLNATEILDKVTKLQGVTYEWNDDKTGTRRPEGLQYGFIAQDLQKVFPAMVEEDANGYLMTAYGDFDPMLVEAIKALNQKFEILQEEIDKKQASIESKQQQILAIISQNSNSK